MAASLIVELATRIATDTSKVSEYLAANGYPQPSFDVDTPPSPIPKDAGDIELLRQAVLRDTAELRSLMLGPRDFLVGSGSMQNILLPHQAVTRFGLARGLPVGEETTFAKMAEASGQAESNIRKIVRAAIAQRIFEEPRPGVIRHSAASRLLAEDPGIHDYVATVSDELWPAAAQTCNAWAKFPESEKPNETGFSLANNTTKSMYEFLSEYLERSSRFANMMRGFTSGPSFDVKFVTDVYPWEDHSSGTIVDVGGSQGFICEALARKFPALKFVVQDLEPVISNAQKDISPDVADRITFMAHDFFTPQPIKADVYFFRWIFHNWSDAYCVKILQALIPALKPGAKVIVSKSVMPGPDRMLKKMEAVIRSFDLVMSSIQNARERELEDWEELFRKADSRFQFQGVISPPVEPIFAGRSLVYLRWQSLRFRVEWNTYYLGNLRQRIQATRAKLKDILDNGEIKENRRQQEANEEVG